MDHELSESNMQADFGNNRINWYKWTRNGRSINHGEEGETLGRETGLGHTGFTGKEMN